MDIEKEIKDLKKSIIELELLVEELISSLEAQKLRVSNKEKMISPNHLRTKAAIYLKLNPIW